VKSDGGRSIHRATRCFPVAVLEPAPVRSEPVAFSGRREDDGGTLSTWPAASDAGSKALSLNPPNIHSTSGRDESYAIRLSAAAILLESFQTALNLRSMLWRRAEHSRENVYDEFQ
jgi:hypothetical protein